MMRQLRAAVAIVVLGCSGAAIAGAQAAQQEVSEADKARALEYLEKTKQGVVDATKGLSDAQWNFKPGPDRWSIAQVMEHIAAAEDYIRGYDADQVMKAPAGTADHDAKKTDDAVMANVPDRSHKLQAPEPLVPTNRFGSPENSLKHFVESRQKTEEFVKGTPGLREHVSDSPLGKLDGYEFVLLIAAHSERHTKQIQEVKTDANYPEN